MKLTDGWHKIPGDGQVGSPEKRGWHGNTSRYYWWAGVINGEIVQTWGHSDIAPPSQVPSASDIDSLFITEVQQFWGSSAQALICPPTEASWGKVLAGVAAGLIGVGVAGRFRKRTTAAVKQTKSIEQPEEIKS